MHFLPLHRPLLQPVAQQQPLQPQFFFLLLAHIGLLHVFISF